MNFSHLVSSATQNAMSATELRICPDQFVGRINTFSADQSDFPVRVSASERPEGLLCLIMVIESPHKQEFMGNLGPAKGSTGNLIRKWIKEIRDLFAYHNYGLILVNAIQFQCSLGRPTKEFRDDVFKHVWGDRGGCDFRHRLKAIHREGDVIANCCTKGNLKESNLRALVQAAIVKTVINCTIHRRTHPSSWYSKNNREYEWKT